MDAISESSTLGELKEFVRKHDLDVALNVGGRDSRTKQDIFEEAQVAYREKYPRARRELFPAIDGSQKVKSRHSSSEDRGKKNMYDDFNDRNLSAESAPEELRSFIIEHNLDVSRQLGGLNSRTKEQMIVDIIEKMAERDDADPEWVFEQYISRNSHIDVFRWFLKKYDIPVSPGVGGPARRTKEDIYDDIQAHFETTTDTDSSPIPFSRLSPQSPIKHLRRYIKEKDLGISTTGKGRNKTAIYDSISKLVEEPTKHVYETPKKVAVKSAAKPYYEAYVPPIKAEMSPPVSPAAYGRPYEQLIHHYNAANVKADPDDSVTRRKPSTRSTNPNNGSGQCGNVGVVVAGVVAIFVLAGVVGIL